MKLGGRIGCTHIHDNDAEKDLHYLPFYGKNNWEEIMKALALSGYAGNLSYESGSCICNKSLPVELYEHGLKYMVEIARYLRSRF